MFFVFIGNIYTPSLYLLITLQLLVTITETVNYIYIFIGNSHSNFLLHLFGNNHSILVYLLTTATVSSDIDW